MDEIESVEINWYAMLDRFYCEYHKRDQYIVNRGPGVFVLDCGCCYMMNDDVGVRWMNTTQPKEQQE